MKASRNIAAVLRRRLYSAQAAAQVEEQVAALPKQSPKLTKLPNGAVVASYENYAPVSRIAVAVNAGPRFEAGPHIGMAHCLRSIAELSNQSSSSFIITKKIQQTGGSLTVTSSRENNVYSLDCLRDGIDTGCELLSHITTKPQVRPWELQAAVARQKLDLALIANQPEVQLIEALHEAAFKGGLEHSLYMPGFKLGGYTAQQVEEYMARYYTAGRAAIVGVGVDHEHLVNLARSFNFPTTNTETPAGGYSGGRFSAGERRVWSSSPFVHAALVTEGASYTSKDATPLFVLQYALGSGPHIKYSNNMAGSKVSQAAAKGTSGPFAGSCLNVSYSDTGLFGFHVVASAQDIGNVLRSVIAQYADATKGGISEQDIAKAKAQAKAAVAMELESAEGMAGEFVEQALFTGQLTDYNSIAASIEKVSLADVQSVAKKVINGKPTFAAVGDLTNTPHLDDLMK